MTAVHAQLQPYGRITTPAQRYCHSDLVHIVADAINTLTLNEGELQLAADTDLSTELRLEGRDILDVFERLEEQLGLQLWPAMALDLVLAGPTIGRLARVLSGRLTLQGARHAD